MCVQCFLAWAKKKKKKKECFAFGIKERLDERLVRIEVKVHGRTVPVVVWELLWWEKVEIKPGQTLTAQFRKRGPWSWAG